MRILVVDDSRVMRAIITRCLRQAGYGAHGLAEAGTGAEALEAIRATTTDLVLSDWNMPEMSGIELLQAIRRLGLDTPFGLVTSEGSPQMRDRAVSEGAAFLIAKPFTAETFQDVLRPVLG